MTSELRVVPKTVSSCRKKPASRGLITQWIKRIESGNIRLVDEWGTIETGHPEAELQAELVVSCPTFYGQAVSGGELGIAESYLEGHWNCSDLTSLFRIILRSAGAMTSVRDRLRGLALWLVRLRSWHRRNNRRGSRKNIHEHYDLGNNFFQLFLDRTMNYSCAIFDEPGMSLEVASKRKMQTLCDDLQLKESDHLLEIGTGWGALALFAAQQYGCRVTTTTISQEQFDHARDRIREAGLADRVTVLKQDYRDLAGTYDKVISVEMIEAVGQRYLPIFFDRCHRLLRPGGVMSLQAILMNMKDRDFGRYARSTDFIREYIFPGGFLPSQQLIGKILQQQGVMEIDRIRDIGSHYVTTLQQWRDRFVRAGTELHQLGFPDRFLRLWKYYFSYCEAGFAERHCTAVQMVLRKYST